MNEADRKEMLDGLRAQTESEEGRKPQAYLDSKKLLTIGIGRLIDPSVAGSGLSEEEIDFLFSNDVKRVEEEVLIMLPWATKLSPPRMAVLLQMAFQMGIHGLMKFQNTLAAVELGDYETAAKGMLNSLWAKQTPERAAREAEQMRTGYWVYKPGFAP